VTSKTRKLVTLLLKQDSKQRMGLLSFLPPQVLSRLGKSPKLVKQIQQDSKLALPLQVVEDSAREFIAHHPKKAASLKIDPIMYN